jgi:hypothetical protein
MPPPRRTPTASSSGIASRGPHAAQAIVSAWKRRSAGSWYSRRQSAHRGKAAIVVFARSYGIARRTVNRGPQFVQVMNGWRWRRSSGSNSSLRHSSHVAASAGTRVVAVPAVRLAAIANPASPVGGSERVATPSMRASEGGGRR